MSRQRFYHSDEERAFLMTHAGQPCFFYNTDTGEYTCFNSDGERAGVIYRDSESNKWAFTDYFVSETDLFDSADEAQEFFIVTEQAEREKRG